MLSMKSSAFLVLIILSYCSTGSIAIPRPGPVIGMLCLPCRYRLIPPDYGCRPFCVNTACTSESIQSFCKPGNLYCVRSACSQCILRDPFNPFASFCARLTDCVCSISNDPLCEQKVQETCY